MLLIFLLDRVCLDPVFFVMLCYVPTDVDCLASRTIIPRLSLFCHPLFIPLRILKPPSGNTCYLPLTPSVIPFAEPGS